MKKWFFGIIFSLLALVSCNEDMLNPDGGLDMTLKSTTPVLLYDGTAIDACGTKILNLTGGQTYVVGTVEVSNDETNLYVTYKYLPTVYIPWFGNLHLWVGTDLATLPRSGGGAPINGQFPYTFNGEPTGPYGNGSWFVTQYTFTIPLVEIPNFSKCGDKLYIVAHAETHCDINGDEDCNDEGETETSFAGSIPGTGTERWFFYDEFTVGCCGVPVVTGTLETAFAFGDWVFVGGKTKANPDKLDMLNLTLNRWGWATNVSSTYPTFFPTTYIGPTNIYSTTESFNSVTGGLERTFTSNIYAGAGLNIRNNGVIVGKATITMNGMGGAYVKYDLNAPYKLKEIHFYANNLKPKTCAPGQYDITVYFDEMQEDYTTEAVPLSADLEEDGFWFIVHAVVNL